MIEEIILCIRVNWYRAGPAWKAVLIVTFFDFNLEMIDTM